MNAERMQAYLDALATHGGRVKAARAAGITYNSLIAARAESEDFRLAELHALDCNVELMELEARRRAVEGVEQAIYHKDGVVGYEQKYSDTLLMFLLKGNHPDKYAERTKAQITGADGTALFDATGAAAKIGALLDEARRRRDDIK